MALVLDDRVQETTTTTGTGTVTLLGAVFGYQSFSVIGNANTTYYTIAGGNDWETGLGTYTSSGTTLARTTVLDSSNGGSLVNFSAGTKSVFVTYPASEAVLLTDTQTLTNKTLTSPTITGAVVSSMASSVISAGTVVAVSGTNVGFTNIPSWVKRITLQLYAVSTNGTSGNLTAQFGTGATPTYVTSGYAGTSSIIRGSTSTASGAAISSGFDLLRGLSNTAFTSGTFVFTLVDVATYKWVCSAVIGRSDEATTIFTAGYIELSSILTAVRLTTTTGVNSFDSGSLNILFE